MGNELRKTTSVRANEYLSDWLLSELRGLAITWNEPMADERQFQYARHLSDLSEEQLRVAFNRAVRECNKFPSVAELRALATGSTVKQQLDVEAMVAWDTANHYLREWGVDLMPVYSRGAIERAPVLPPRIEYALRRIGGLMALNQITEERRPFMVRDFVQAFNEAPIVDSDEDRVLLQGVRKILVRAKELRDGAA